MWRERLVLSGNPWKNLAFMPTDPLTAMQWETIFPKISSTIDDLLLAKGNTSSIWNIGFDIITPNQLKLGRNNNRSLTGSGLKLDLSPNFSGLLEQNRKA